MSLSGESVGVSLCSVLLPLPNKDVFKKITKHLLSGSAEQRASYCPHSHSFTPRSASFFFSPTKTSVSPPLCGPRQSPKLLSFFPWVCNRDVVFLPIHFAGHLPNPPIKDASLLLMFIRGFPFPLTFAPPDHMCLRTF